MSAVRGSMREVLRKPVYEYEHEVPHISAAQPWPMNGWFSGSGPAISLPTGTSTLEPAEQAPNLCLLSTIVLRINAEAFQSCSCCKL